MTLPLIRTLVVPESEQAWLHLRTLDITSTESPALFGLSPYATAFELWHRKALSMAADFPDNDRMKWGRRLQNAIAEGIAEDKGWRVRLMPEYGRLMPLKMGSSFDFSIEDHPDGPGILEIKKVDERIYKENWLEGAAPDHIEIQVQHQLEVLDREWAAIGVLIGGNRTEVLMRKRDREVGAMIREKVAAFWESVANGIAPAPNFSVDADFVSKLYGYAEPGKVFDARENPEVTALVTEYADAMAAEKDAVEVKGITKAKILTLIGDHEQILGDGFKVVASVTADNPGEVITEAMLGKVIGARKGSRPLRVYKQKETT
jgi:putative phage-type endonuclease